MKNTELASARWRALSAQQQEEIRKGFHFVCNGGEMHKLAIPEIKVPFTQGYPAVFEVEDRIGFSYRPGTVGIAVFEYFGEEEGGYWLLTRIE